jgi:hypothetical protein
MPLVGRLRCADRLAGAAPTRTSTRASSSPWPALRLCRRRRRLVYVEFHPIIWSIAPDLRIAGDDYFATTPFVEPVNDYVAESGPHLGAPQGVLPGGNAVPAYAWQHGLGDLMTALAGAGMRVESLREYGHANGCRVHPALVAAEGRRWVWPPGVARVPLMFGLSAQAPKEDLSPTLRA